MKNYIRNLTLATSLFLSSSASALEVELASKTETPWTLAEQNSWVIYGFGVEEHKYTIQVFDTDVTRAADNRIQFIEDITRKIYDLEKKEEKPALRFSLDRIRQGILQHPRFNGKKPLQPGKYDIQLKQIYGSGLMSTT